MGLRELPVGRLVYDLGFLPKERSLTSDLVITDTLIQTSDLMVRRILAVNRHLTARGLGSVLFSCVSTLHFETEAIQ